MRTKRYKKKKYSNKNNTRALRALRFRCSNNRLNNVIPEIPDDRLNNVIPEIPDNRSLPEIYVDS